MASDANDGLTSPKEQPNTKMEDMKGRQQDKLAKFVHPIKIEFKPQNPLKTQGNNTKAAEGKTMIFNQTASTKQLIKVLMQVNGTYLCDKEGNNEVKVLEEFPKDDESFKKLFDVKRSKRSNSVFVYCYIKSPTYLTTIKNDPDVWKYISDNGIYINNAGSVKIDEQEVIGFINFKHPKLTNFSEFSVQLQNEIQNMINIHGPTTFDKVEKCELNPIRTDGIPPIETFTHFIKHEVMKDKDDKSSVAAIESCVIQVITKLEDAEWMRTALLCLSEHTTNTYQIGRFIPYQWRRQQPVTFYKIIASQNAWLNKVESLAICGLPKEVLDAPRKQAVDDKDKFMTVRETLMEKEGEVQGMPDIPMIFGIENTMATDDIGKYFITYHQENREKVYEWIDTQLEFICYETGVFERAKFDKFPIPRRMTKKRYEQSLSKTDRKVQQWINGLNKLEDFPELTVVPKGFKKRQTKPQTKIFHDRGVLNDNHKRVEPPKDGWAVWGPQGAVVRAKKAMVDKTSNLGKNEKKTTVQEIAKEMDIKVKEIEEKLTKSMEKLMTDKLDEITTVTKPEEETVSTLTKTMEEGKKKEAEINANFRQMTDTKIQRMDNRLKSMADKTKKELEIHYNNNFQTRFDDAFKDMEAMEAKSAETTKRVNERFEEMEDKLIKVVRKATDQTKKIDETQNKVQQQITSMGSRIDQVAVQQAEMANKMDQIMKALNVKYEKPESDRTTMQEIKTPELSPKRKKRKGPKTPKKKQADQEMAGTPRSKDTAETRTTRENKESHEEEYLGKNSFAALAEDDSYEECGSVMSTGDEQSGDEDSDTSEDLHVEAVPGDEEHIQITEEECNEIRSQLFGHNEMEENNDKEETKVISATQLDGSQDTR